MFRLDQWVIPTLHKLYSVPVRICSNLEEDHQYAWEYSVSAEKINSMLEEDHQYA